MNSEEFISVQLVILVYCLAYIRKYLKYRKFYNEHKKYNTWAPSLYEVKQNIERKLNELPHVLGHQPARTIKNPIENPPGNE